LYPLLSKAVLHFEITTFVFAFDHCQKEHAVLFCGPVGELCLYEGASFAEEQDAFQSQLTFEMLQ